MVLGDTKPGQMVRLERTGEIVMVLKKHSTPDWKVVKRDGKRAFFVHTKAKVTLLMEAS
jgi:hypothetical protein